MKGLWALQQMHYVLVICAVEVPGNSSEAPELCCVRCCANTGQKDLSFCFAKVAWKYLWADIHLPSSSQRSEGAALPARGTGQAPGLLGPVFSQAKGTIFVEIYSNSEAQIPRFYTQGPAEFSSGINQISQPGWGCLQGVWPAQSRPWEHHPQQGSRTSAATQVCITRHNKTHCTHGANLVKHFHLFLKWAVTQVPMENPCMQLFPFTRSCYSLEERSF